MKSVFHSAPFKFLIALLASLSLLGTVALGLTTFVLEEAGIYKEDYRSPAERTAEYRAETNLYYAMSYHLDKSNTHPIEEDFVFCIVHVNESATVWDTGAEKAKATVTRYFIQKKGEEHGQFVSGEDLDYLTASPDTHDIYRITGGFLPTSKRIAAIEQAKVRVASLQKWRTPLPVLGGGCLILTVFFAVHLCLGAGRKKDGETVVLNRADRIPLDLVLGGLTAIGIAFVALIYQIVRMFDDIDLQAAAPIISIGLICEAASLLLMWLLYTVAARIKGKTLLKNTVLYRVFHWAYRGLKRLWDLILRLFRKIPTVPGVASVMGFLALCNILLGLLSRDAGVFLLLTLEWIALFVAVILMAVGFSYLQKKTKAMARGNLRETVDTKYLIGPLKEQAEDLNRIEEGLTAAVNEQMKSERMKTELITNVSHDIKTPLTSIINYTDLLSKEENLSHQATEYLEVLQRQSARLKKLTDDIVEASKASSGAMTVEFAPCDLNVLLEQTVGEYRERAEERGLSVILSVPEAPVMILADGRRLWRIFENLMNNIRKYALSGTRVYLTLTEEDGQARITFRNISKEALNINPEELTERFVRGDQSRNTEGSGLGLAIARSLTELQKGTFRIDIDGDLFKVTLSFPLLARQ